MIHFDGTEETQLMLRHTANEMRDSILSTGGYTEEDDAVVDKIETMGQSGSSLVLTGAEMTAHEMDALMRKVIRAEVDNWVADTSQRLLHRAFLALGYRYGAEHILTESPDCGAEFSWHALVREWLLGDTYMRCVTCGHLYKD